MSEPYRSPAGLGASKYAPAQQSIHFARAFPSAPTQPAANYNNNTIATKAQIAAASSDEVAAVQSNVGAQLAVDRNAQLEAEAADLVRLYRENWKALKSMMALLREDAMKKNPARPQDELDNMNAAFDKIDRLCAWYAESNDALPKYLDRQRNNMNLYHSSVVNEVYQESKDELSRQNKKADRQYSLILEQQEAFQDYRKQTEAKLNDLNDLHERNSRLTLDKGLMRAEIDKAHKDLEFANSELNKAEGAMSAQVASLELSKKELATEMETIRKQCDEHQQALNKEQSLIVRYKEEVRRLETQLEKEVQKAASLQTLTENLQNGDGAAKQESHNLKVELNSLNRKYENQAAEYSRAFSLQAEQAKKLGALKAELQKKDADLVKAKDDLSSSKGEAAKELVKAMEELSTAKSDVDNFKKTVAALNAKIKKLEGENDDLETENNDLLAREQKQKKAAVEFEALKAADEHRLKAEIEALKSGADEHKSENDRLEAEVDGLRKKTNECYGQIQDLQKKLEDANAKETNLQGKDVVNDNALTAEIDVLRMQVQEDRIKQAELEEKAEDWMNLGKLSYLEYKSIHPTYLEAENYRKAAVGLEKQVAELQAQLATATASAQPNGADTAAETGYWKAKYEDLVNSMD